MKPRTITFDSAAATQGLYGVREHDLIQHTALTAGSYSLAGGAYNTDRIAYIYHSCPHCDNPVSSPVITEKTAYLMTCENCRYEVATITSYLDQLDVNNYDGLHINDIESFKKAIYISAMISVFGTYSFLKTYISDAANKHRYIDTYLEFVADILTTSILRNDETYGKVLGALLRKYDNPKTFTYDFGIDTLLSFQNIRLFLEQIKLNNFNIFTEDSSGIPYKMVFITTEVFPIFLPLELFDYSFIEKIKETTGSILQVSDKPKEVVKIPEIFKEGIATLNIKNLKEIPKDIQCEACGNFLEEDDLKEKKCSQCKTPLKLKGEIKKVAKKKTSKKKILKRKPIKTEGIS